MSWSIHLHGKPRAVEKLIDGEVLRCSNGMAEPEVVILSAVGEIAKVAVEKYPDNLPITIVASGSQSDPYYGQPRAGKFAVNSVNLKIEAIYGFHE